MLPDIEHGPLVAHIAHIVGLEDAEDVVQDAYVKILSTSSPFQGKASAKTWTYAVARNTARDWLRLQKRRPRHSPALSDLDRLAALAEEPTRFYDMHAAIEKLKPIYRSVILVRLEHDAIRDTADALGVSPSAVKMRYRRAVIALRILMGVTDDA